MNSDPPHPVIGVLISWRYVTPIVESCLLGISRVATYFCEYDADDFAVKLGLGLGLKNALLALVGSLKSYPLEDSWYAAWFGGHPDVLDRVYRILKAIF